MVQTLNPLQTWLSIPAIGPIFGNNVAYGIGYAGGVIAGIGVDIVIGNAMGAECATASALTQAAKLAGKAEAFGQMLDSGMNILSGKGTAGDYARFTLSAVALLTSTSCFVAGTQVVVGLKPDGSYQTKSIDQIQVGDYVLTRSQYDADGPLELEQVVATYVHEVTSIRTLSIEDASGNVETIRVTDDHPFWVENVGWVAAKDLAQGYVVSTPTGGTAVVVGNVSELLAEPIKVYNLQVASGHTYFVEDGQGAQTPIWVHNTCAPAGGVAKVHGNSALSSRTTSLYRLADSATGKLLKWGISQNPLTRYTKAFMAGKKMEIVAEGSRSLMMTAERFAILREAGPLNNERWLRNILKAVS